MWQVPKTDWKWISETEGDFFETEDYNRIKGNIDYLHELALQLYAVFNFDTMGADKEKRDFPYADEINLLCDNLEKIASGTYPLDIGEKITYEENGIFIGYADLNRIETACNKYYVLLTTQLANISTVPFRCGSGIGEVF